MKTITGEFSPVTVTEDKMKKLRIGIIGTGGISHCHMNGYKVASDLCEVVACCDIDFEKAKKYAANFGIPAVYDNCYDMLKKEQLDCVSVCTWNAAHKECTIAALDAGVNVICEKPMAMNAKEAQEMYDAAKKSGKLLQVGFVRRFGRDADTVLGYSKEGVLGDVYYAKAQYLRRDGCPGGWFKDKNFSGGGPLIDLGVHVIDLCRYLAGNPKPVCAYGVTYNNLGPNRAAGGEEAWAAPDKKEHPYNVEDLASALIRFDNGFTIQLETAFNLNLAGDSTTMQIFGTKAGAALDGDIKLYTTMCGRHVNIQPQGNSHFDFTESFNAEMRGFLDAVNGVAPCRAPAEDGLWLMKIIDAVYESAKTGRSVDIQ